MFFWTRTFQKMRDDAFLNVTDEPWLPCLLPDFKKFRRWEEEQKTITLRGEAGNYCCLLLEHVTDLRLVGRKIAKKTNIQRRLLRKVIDFLSKTSVAAVTPVVLLACQQGSCWWLTGYGGKYWWSEGLLVDRKWLDPILFQPFLALRA